MPLNIDPLFDPSLRFTTPRLSLAPFRPEDLEDLKPVNRDPEVTKYLPYPTWHTQEDADAWLARLQKRTAAREGLQFAVRLREPNRVIGNALMFGFNNDAEVAEIGYVIGRAHWGQGYVVEAMGPLVEFAFSTMGCHRLEAKLDTLNTGSARVLEKLGFTHEGTSREDWVKEGVRGDTAFYGLLRREWRGRA